MASIFLLLMIGYACKKLKVLDVKDAGVVNAIVINLTLPAFIFTSVHDKPLTMGMVKAPFVGLAAQMVVIAAAYGCARLLKLNRPTTASLMLAATFGNTGYMGLPVVAAVFGGDKGSLLAAVMMDSFAMRLGLCTVGIAVVTSFAGSRFEWKNLLGFFWSPLFGAIVIGLLLRTVHIPFFLMNTLDYLGRPTVPLSMISVGLTLSAASLKDYPVAFGVAFVLKMLALPALTYLALPLLGIEHSVARVAVLEMAMPSAVFTGVIANRYGANATFNAGAIFLTTLASVVMIPIVLMLVR